MNTQEQEIARLKERIEQLEYGLRVYMNAIAKAREQFPSIDLARRLLEEPKD